MPDTTESEFTGIELKLNDHRNERGVYLEREVLQALTEFYKRCSQPDNN